MFQGVFMQGKAYIRLIPCADSHSRSNRPNPNVWIAMIAPGPPSAEPSAGKNSLRFPKHDHSVPKQATEE